ncbi:MAG: archease [Candidatus Promineifilaceae bacterium]
MPTMPMKQPENATGFEVVEHTADWALRVWGRNMKELFASAATGMGTLMVADLESLPLDVERDLELEAFDAETLLVDWLSELAFWAEDEQLVFREFDLAVTADFRLRAVVRGGRAEELVMHIKAVTYHDLVIEKTRQALEATIVFDV